ncbi:alpha/beta hydrolase [Sodalis sp. RH20]|uniref:alpha/beta hydrolase n=1 Tax=unclassified Sodalis (in: enterobacteria) TaxID=2636512 RepID=UPI0039B3DAB2
MKKLVVLLHGVGSSGAGMQGVAQLLRQLLPDVIVSTPDGTSSFAGGNAGYQWFSVQDITENSRPRRIAEARSAFDGVLREIFRQHDFVPGEDQLILLGFSQGAIMALDALVTNRLPLIAVVAFSGRLSSPEPWSGQIHAKALLIHGTSDAVIPWRESENACVRLRDAGIEVETLFEPGISHTISASGIKKAAEYIARRFNLNG